MARWVHAGQGATVPSECFEPATAVLTLPGHGCPVPFQCQLSDQPATAEMGPACGGLVKGGGQFLGLSDLMAGPGRRHSGSVPLCILGGTPRALDVSSAEFLDSLLSPFTA